MSMVKFVLTSVPVSRTAVAMVVVLDFNCHFQFLDRSAGINVPSWRSVRQRKRAHQLFLRAVRNVPTDTGGSVAGRWVWLYLCQSVVLAFRGSSARLRSSCRHYNYQPIVEARVRVGHVLILIYSDAPTMLRQSPDRLALQLKSATKWQERGGWLLLRSTTLTCAAVGYLLFLNRTHTACDNT